MNLRRGISTFRGHRVPHFRIIERRNVWFGLSGAFIVLSLVGLFVVGLTYSIDFKGGALLSFPNASHASISDYQAVLGRFNLESASTVEIVNGNQVQIRTKSLTTVVPTTTPSASASPSATASPATSPTASASPSPTASATASPTPSAGASASAGAPAPGPSPSATPTAVVTPPPPQQLVGDEVRKALAAVAGVSADRINEQDVGPTWGSQISKKAVQGLIIFLVLVTVYISFRFEWKMAIAALGALLHDLIITAGIYALVGREVTPASVIAILTILGYSLYDTVVIFDKVKENTDNAALVARETYTGVVDMSLNQTLMRSVNTSLVVLLPIGALLLFGGTTLKDFAFALFVGVASGTYSSIFVASPILAILKEREPRFQSIRQRAEQRQAKPVLKAVTPRRALTTRTGAGAGDVAEDLQAATVGGGTRPARSPSSGARPARPSGAAGGAKKKGARPKPKRRRR